MSKHKALQKKRFKYKPAIYFFSKYLIKYFEANIKD